MPPDGLMLRAVRGPLTGRSVPLGAALVLGRGEDCGLQLPDETASRRHAEIVLEDGAPRLRDLGSANGTYVNGSRVPEGALAIGDLLRIGASEFVLEGPPDPGRSTVLAEPPEKPSAAQLVSAYRELRGLKRLTGAGPELVGDAPAFLAAVALARRAAAVSSTVLVTGPTGSGKELIARLLHAESPRASGPFVPVNCAALPEGLQESELFGHEKGAFTGASRAREGCFELADGGTLFLDEIGELSLSTQAKLLRVLETQSFHRLGASQPTRVDVRVVAATHRDLPAEAAAGRFREDLYHRLDVLRIALPSLAERTGDVSILARYLLRRKAAELALPAKSVAPEALAALERYPWPGNVRELANVLERALVLARGSGIGLEDLPPEIARPRAAATGAPRTLAEIEKQAVREALEATGWNKRAAAERLDISWPTLHKKVQDYGLKPLESPRKEA